MKKFFLFISLMTIVSCTSLDYSILGVWALVDEQFFNDQGQESIGESGIKTWTFKKNGIGYENSSSPFDYSIDGKFLTIHDINKDNEWTYEIQEMTSTYLQVYIFIPRVYLSRPGDYINGHSSIYKFKKIE